MRSMKFWQLLETNNLGGINQKNGKVYRETYRNESNFGEQTGLSLW